MVASINLVGPSQDPGAPLVSTTEINTQVNAALATLMPNTTAALLALIQTLPTVLPSQPGVLWLNGGVLCVS